jgi:arabinose-5-phosphate isomerase
MIPLHSIIKQEAQAILKIPDETASQIGILSNVLCKQTNTIITSGMGKAGLIAQQFAFTLCSIGVPAFFLNPAEAQHGDLGMIRKKDIIILFSNSGQTREVIEMVELILKIYPTILIALVTGNADSPLTKQSQLILLTGNPAEVCPLGLTPTTSTTVMSVISDMIIVRMIELLHLTPETYYQYHHSGYLGQQAKQMIRKEK